jgi:hypothetical protein
MQLVGAWGVWRSWPEVITLNYHESYCYVVHGLLCGWMMSRSVEFNVATGHTSFNSRLPIVSLLHGSP